MTELTGSPRTLTWLDRLRIERVVWSLDQRLQDLPRGARISHRLEIRESLISAAQDIGTGPALARLGSSQELAREYLSAEFGDRPRHSWMAAGLFFATFQLFGTSLLWEVAAAYGDGIAVGDPGATGTYTWEGLLYLQREVTYTFTDGDFTFVGGSWSLFAWVLWIGGAILVGRLWRAIPAWRRRDRRRALAVSGL